MCPRRSNLKPDESSTYIVEPIHAHTQSVILLHGLGDNGYNFGTLFLREGLTFSGCTLTQLLPGARFIFPTAKRRRSSAFRRAKLTQWFDIARLPDPEYRKETQLHGLAESSSQLVPLIHEEVDKVGAQNVILGGISNGSAMSMSLLLALGLPLGGYIGLCSYLPYQKDILEAVMERTDCKLDKDDVFAQDEEEEAEKSVEIRALEFERDLLCMEPFTDVIGCRALSTTPIFLGHGELDEKKPPALGQAAAETLRAIGFDVTWKLYSELGHWYKVPDEIEDIADFVKCRVGWRLAGDKALRGKAPP